MIALLAKNIVLRQLPRLIADAEALLSVAAYADLPAGCRIIGCADGLAGFCLGSGHRLAQAHGCRQGAVAVGVAAEGALLKALEWWPDEPDAVLGEAGVMIESVACHELAHALVADIDGGLTAHEASVLRQLPGAVKTPPPAPFERTASDHGAAWAAASMILSRRCRQYRPWARHRWAELLGHDLRAVGIDADAVALAVGDVADELPLRELLASGAAVVARVAEAIPDEATRALLIAERANETTPAEPGHVAPVAAGVL
jgi:hypothetical protein